jgi:hypothetical protein
MDMDEARTLTRGTPVMYRGGPNGPFEDGWVVRVEGTYVVVRYRGSSANLVTDPEQLEVRTP